MPIGRYYVIIYLKDFFPVLFSFFLLHCSFLFYFCGLNMQRMWTCIVCLPLYRTTLMWSKDIERRGCKFYYIYFFFFFFFYKNFSFSSANKIVNVFISVYFWFRIKWRTCCVFLRVQNVFFFFFPLPTRRSLTSKE